MKQKPKSAKEKAINEFKILFKKEYFHSNEKLSWKYPAEREFLDGIKIIFDNLISSTQQSCEDGVYVQKNL